MGKLEYVHVECPEHGLLGFAGRPARYTRSSLGILRCLRCGRKVVEAEEKEAKK